MITYNPKDAVRCLPEGRYPATLADVVERQSKAGNDMHELKWTVYRGDESTVLFDYIAYPKMVWRLKKLAAALGVLDLFDAGKFDPADFKGHNLTLELTIRNQVGFDESNTVKAYLPKETVPTAPPDADDDLPF